jgi:hypothetical protein
MEREPGQSPSDIEVAKLATELGVIAAVKFPQLRPTA